MPEDKGTSEGLTGLIESLDKLAKVAGLLAIVFLVVLGCSYKLGEDSGLDTGRQIRQQHGKPVLKTLPVGDAALFWKDDKIIQGGLYGLLTIAVLLTYVAVMVATRRPPRETLTENIATYLVYPNCMGALVAGYMLLLDLHSELILAFLGSVALAICCWRSQFRSHLATQILILIGQTLILSFLIGETRGIKAADFERRYPLVEVLNTDSTVTKGLRLLKAGDSEYRFIDSSGREQMIPKTQIRAISLVP